MIDNKRGLGQGFRADFVNFRGRREDHNLILELTQDSGSIINVKERRIKQVIEKFSQNGETDNIRFLLFVADNLKYGYNNESPLGSFLNASSSIADKTEKQNTNWAKLLEESIEKTLQRNNSPEKAELQRKFQEIYPKLASGKIDSGKFVYLSVNPDNAVFIKQAELIKLREQIFNSEEFSKVYENLTKKEQEDLSLDKLKIKRNLDYFMASSECPLSEKIEVLKQFTHMMSPEYSINQQLKDKKIKVLSEILNDIIIKTPEEDKLTIKAVDQVNHGMCAAISQCRKRLAYEDKVNYVQNIMSELDDQPEMKVFDITNLETGIKVPVKKTHIDFNMAIKDGYRIIDASALQWMHISGSIGNGEIAVETYTAFDPQHYRLFNDSKWNNDLPGDMLQEHNYLRTLIKAKDDATRVEKKIIKRNLAIEDARLHKDSIYKQISDSYKHVEDAISTITGTSSKDKVRNLAKKLLNQENLKDKNFKIIAAENEHVKKYKLAQIIKSEVEAVDEKALKSVVDRVYFAYQVFSNAKKLEATARDYALPKEKAKYYKNLFTVAANHRICTEYELDIPSVLEEYANNYKIPDKQQLITASIDRLTKEVKAGRNIAELAEKFGLESDQKTVLNALTSLKQEVSTEIPKKVDTFLGKLGVGNRQTCFQVLTSRLIEQFESSKELTNTYLPHYSKLLDIKPDKRLLIEKLTQLHQELGSYELPEKRLTEIANSLGYKDQVKIAKDYFNFTCTTVIPGITEDYLDKLAQNLGVDSNPGDVEEGINNLNMEIRQLAATQEAIAELVNAPPIKELVLQNLEKEGIVLSRKILDNFSEKFDQIAEFERQQEIAEKSGKKLNPGDIYKFTEEQKSILKEIKTEFIQNRRHIDRKYKEYNTKLAPYLDQLYDETGREKGHFWLSEEGHSGLFHGEQVRIAEQMTGRPHYIEYDPLKAVELIKNTGKSGVCASQVDYDEYSGHAQYISDIREIPVYDSKTGKIESKDVIFHDNSWGPKEKEKTWEDRAGNERTNYGRNLRGGSEGYIVDPQYRNGTLVEDYATRYGVNQPEIPDSKKLKKLVDGVGDRFAIFNDVILEGCTPRLSVKNMELVNKIFDQQSNISKAEKFISALKRNPQIAINIKELENVEDFAYQETEKLLKLIKGDDKSKGIVSVEDFNKLPENHRLKVILRKISIYDNQYGYYVSPYISAANNHHELDQVEERMIETLKAGIKKFFAISKKVDVEVRTMNELKEQFYCPDDVIKWIDNKFDPANDEEFIKKFNEIRKMSPQKIKRLLNESTRRELGIEFSDPYTLVQRIRSEHYQAEKSLQKAILEDTLHRRFNIEKILNKSQKSRKEALEQQYRSLYVTLTNLDTDKQINQFKNEAFEKYNVRPAFPRIKVIEEQELSNFTEDALNHLSKNINGIAALDDCLKIQRISGQLKKSLKSANLDSPEDVEKIIKPILLKLKELCGTYDELTIRKLKANINSALKSDGEAFKDHLKKIESRLDKFKKEYPAHKVKRNLETSRKTTRENLITIVKANIDPRHQPRIMKMLNEWVKCSIVDPENSKNQELYNQIVTEFNNKHITNNPVEILHSLVKQSKQTVGNRKTNSNVKKVLTRYLTSALKAAKLTEIEFSIIKDIGNGNINKFKAFIQNAGVNLHFKVQEKTPITSEQGLLSLINSLFDPINDNRTLKLFLESAGLNEQAAATIMQECRLDEFFTVSNQSIDELKQFKTEFFELKNSFNNFIRTVKENDVTQNINDIFTSFFKSLDETIITDENNPGRYMETYKNAVENMLQTNIEKQANSSTKDLVSDIHKTAFTEAYAVIKETISQINTCYQDLELSNRMLEIIRIPEHSPVYEIKESFHENAFKLLKVMSKNMLELTKLFR